MQKLKLSPAANYRIAFSLVIGLQAILLAYAPLYFSSLGYTPFEVSVISGMENIAGILGPALLVARTYPGGLGVTILSASSAVLMLFISPLFGSTSLVITWALSLFFNRGVFVLINEGAQAREREGQLSYSETRSWGSASFLFVMYGVGVVVNSFGISCSIVIGSTILFLLALNGLSIREQLIEESPKSLSEFFQESFTRWHLIFFTVMTLIWASHGPAYTYMSIHLINLGWSTEQMAQSWNIAVLTEILVFLAFSKVQRYLSLENFLTLTQIACIIRWTIISTTSNPILINLSQVLHGLTFGLCFVASQKLLVSKVDQVYRKPAFAVYFSVTMGCGSLIGKLIAGWSTTASSFNGDFHQTFLWGVYLSLASLLIWSMRSTVWGVKGPVEK